MNYARSEISCLALDLPGYWNLLDSNIVSRWVPLDCLLHALQWGSHVDVCRLGSQLQRATIPGDPWDYK